MGPFEKITLRRKSEETVISIVFFCVLRVWIGKMKKLVCVDFEKKKDYEKKKVLCVWIGKRKKLKRQLDPLFP